MAQTGTPAITTDCFECGTNVAIAPWEEPLIEILCTDCHDDVPEFSLWEDPDPIPDGENWVVLDHHRNHEENVIEKFEGDTKQEVLDNLNDHFNAEMSHVFDPPEDLLLDIYLRDTDDIEALKEAREEATRRLQAHQDEN